MVDRFFTGHWESDFHSLSIDFNENVWRLVNDGHDQPEGALFGLFSENDGASFSLDYALKNPQLDYNYEYAEAEFFSRMFNLDNQCQRLDEITLNIDGLDFLSGLYSFHNRKYGEQTVVRAMHIDQDFVIGIGMAWPQHTLSEKIVPPKFQLLLDNLYLH